MKTGVVGISSAHSGDWPDLTDAQADVISYLERRLRYDHGLALDEYALAEFSVNVSNVAPGAVRVTVRFSLKGEVRRRAYYGPPSFDLVIKAGGALLARQPNARRVSRVRGVVPRIA